MHSKTLAPIAGKILLILAGSAFFALPASATPHDTEDPLSFIFFTPPEPAAAPAPAPLPDADAAPAPTKFGLKIVKTVKQQLGTPYRYGEEEPDSGFDCSGLVWWVYRQHGVNLPRTTTELAKVGEDIPLSDAHVGDIIIFRTGRGATGLHTGILTGPSRFIHAPRTGKNVMESTLNEYWAPRIVTIRHVRGLRLPERFPSADELSLALSQMDPTDFGSGAEADTSIDPLFDAIALGESEPARLGPANTVKNSVKSTRHRYVLAKNEVIPARQAPQAKAVKTSAKASTKPAAQTAKTARKAKPGFERTSLRGYRSAHRRAAQPNI